MVRLGWPPSFAIMSTIDREGPVPPYRQIAAILRKRIADGEIPVGRRIPSLTDMDKEFEVARDTLQKAVQVLRDEGLVETARGMGVYVIKVPDDA